jgi:hypothetical protein
MQMIDLQGVSKLRIAAGDARLRTTQMRFAFLDLKNSNSDDTRPEATGPPPNAPTSLRFAAHDAPKEMRDRRLPSGVRCRRWINAVRWGQLATLVLRPFPFFDFSQPVG